MGAAQEALERAPLTAVLPIPSGRYSGGPSSRYRRFSASRTDANDSGSSANTAAITARSRAIAAQDSNNSSTCERDNGAIA